MRTFIIERDIPGAGRLSREELGDAAATSNRALATVPFSNIAVIRRFSLSASANRASASRSAASALPRRSDTGSASQSGLLLQLRSGIRETSLGLADM